VDKAVIKYYRQLLREDFRHSGSLENSSIFIESIGEKTIHCGNTGNYMQLYLNIVGRRIEEIRYLCSCVPTANVAVEILCTLVKGKTLEEAAGIPEDTFYRYLGSENDEFKIKVRGLLEMLREGISGYEAQTASPKGTTGNRQW
jgi:NifU-like protein involved in Fe-S cluster formation